MHAHLSLLGFYPETWQVCKVSINLLTLAGLRTVFGVAGPSVTNLLTLAGLWTLVGYNHGTLEPLEKVGGGGGGA